METLKLICTCDDHCDSPCPTHARENMLQDETIKLREIVKKLQKIASDMKGQDNQFTAFPIFVVQQRKRIYGIDPEYSDDIAWICDGSEVSEDDPDLLKAKAEYEELGELSPEYEDWIVTRYIDEWEFVQPFFSEKAAKAYLERNRHNLKNPRIYVDSGHRNKEWQTLLEVFEDLQKEEASL